MQHSNSNDTKTLTIGEALREAEQALTTAAIDNPGLDARVLVAAALSLDRSQLLSQSKITLKDGESQKITDLVQRRVNHEPVSRILGSREFWSLEFGINEATLVPRPESETLIEMALAMLPDKNQKLRILDLGAGTGCLLLALLSELPRATGLGVDVAARAVEQAIRNAEALDFQDRALFRVNNWADGVDEQFDLVISNPPYVASAEMAGLMPEVRDHDPALALVAGADGLDAYRVLIPQLPKLLRKDGVAIMEIGEGQGEAVHALFKEAGFGDLATQRDLAGTERCIAGSLG